MAIDRFSEGLQRYIAPYAERERQIGVNNLKNAREFLEDNNIPQSEGAIEGTRTNLGRMKQIDELGQRIRAFHQSIKTELTSLGIPQPPISFLTETAALEVPPKDKTFEDIAREASRVRTCLGYPEYFELTPTQAETPIETLTLSSRSYFALKRSQLTEVGHLIRLTQDELLAIRNMGQKQIVEISQSLANHGVVPVEGAEELLKDKLEAAEAEKNKDLTEALKDLEPDSLI
jgi:hypothetical protein